MFRSIHPNVGLIVGLVALAAACSAAGGGHEFTASAGAGATGSGTGTTGTTTGQGGGTTSSQGVGGVTFATGTGTGTTTSGSTGTGKPCVVTDPNADMDGDGWSPNEGDCNDCDPNVNPGAIDVPGDPNKVDSDCSGAYDPPVPCDSGLALDDVNGSDGAKAIELCQFTTETVPTLKQKIWGVISAEYVRADGTAYSQPGLQVGLQSAWGTNVHVQAGQSMLSISSGHARSTGETGACGMNSCEGSGHGTPPPGFPQANANCKPSKQIYDDIGLQLDIRTPTNATGYDFNFKFYSFEYPYWVCNSYNDQFIALVNPAPTGSINGNISFDSMNNPVSVNLGFFNVCDPSEISLYAKACPGTGNNCPTPPSPYCPSGTAELAGTGFDLWDGPAYNFGMNYGGAGATSWLQSKAPVTGGEEITIRFTMWDTGDDNFDSTTLIDNFQWIATPGTNVSVSTTPVDMPQ